MINEVLKLAKELVEENKIDNPIMDRLREFTDDCFELGGAESKRFK